MDRGAVAVGRGLPTKGEVWSCWFKQGSCTDLEVEMNKGNYKGIWKFTNKGVIAQQEFDGLLVQGQSR